MDQGKGRILTLEDLYNAVDWSSYKLDMSDSRAAIALRQVYLYDALYDPNDAARQEAREKLGDVYLSARKILDQEGL